MKPGTNGDANHRLASSLEAYKIEAAGRWIGCDLDRNVEKALACIHENLFEEELDVAAVCVAAGMRNHNFTMDFKFAVGVSIRQYVELLRIEIAGRLIKCNTHSVHDIALAVGYAHPETFSRAFRRVTGRTTRQVRAGDVQGAVESSKHIRIPDSKQRIGA